MLLKEVDAKTRKTKTFDVARNGQEKEGNGVMCPYSTYCGLDDQRIPRSLVNKNKIHRF